MIPSFPNYTSIIPIGRGAFASVYRAIHKSTERTVALKVFNTSATDSEEMTDFDREVKIHRSLDHPFIAHYFGSFKQKELSVIVMEFIPGQSLLDSVNEDGPKNEIEIQKIFCQIIASLEYLHNEKKVVHRDLKLENIIISPNSIVKIIDFGLSNISNGLLSTQCASFPYAAPELFTSEKYTASVDIWASGVCLYAMLCGQLPFEGEDVFQLANKIINSDPDYKEIQSLLAVDLLKHILEKNPSDRFSLKQIIAHPWVKRSPFAHIFQEDKIINPETKVFPTFELDPRIMRFIQNKSLNENNLQISDFPDKENEEMTIYRIMRRSSTNTQLGRIFTVPVETKPQTTSMFLPMFVKPVNVPKKNNKDDGFLFMNSNNANMPGRRTSNESFLAQTADKNRSFAPNVPVRFRPGKLSKMQTFQAPLSFDDI